MTKKQQLGDVKDNKSLFFIVINYSGLKHVFH